MFKQHWPKYLAEFIGTFALVFIGAGAVLAAKNGDIGTVGVALAHGLVLMSIIYSIGHISGAHVNPAVTFATWVTGHMKGKMALSYVVAQLLGSVFAGLLLKIFLFPGILGSGLGAPALRVANIPYPGTASSFMANVSPLTGIVIEAILTFFLVWAIMGSSVDERNSNRGFAGLAIGLVLTFDILVGAALTGGAMNPARAFGPTLVSAGFALSDPAWANQYVYWLGPMLGALAAAVIYQQAFLKRKL